MKKSIFVFIFLFISFSSSSSVPAQTYTTNFPLTENPISEGGRWMNGSLVGLDWTNVSTTQGHAIGNYSTVQYSDPTALLAGSWGPDQTVEATVYSINPTASYYQEVELRLRSSITPHSITGYEIFFRCLKTGSAYAQIVRWNGPLGNFTYLQQKSGVQYGVANGDVVKATIKGNVIKGYINGVEVLSVTDNTYSSGNLGMGFNYGVGNSNVDFGFSTFSATDSDTIPPAPPQNLHISGVVIGVTLLTICIFMAARRRRRSLPLEFAAGVTFRY